MTAAVRPLTEHCLPAVDLIQRAAYSPSFLEELAILADKIAHYPDGCWAAEVEGQVVGYLLSHPACFANPPGLNQLLDVRTGALDCYFIHDVAVLPAHRGQGLAQLLLGMAMRQAAQRGFAEVALIAVQNAQGFWQRRGFQFVPETVPAVAAVRRSYGSQAHYMVRRGA